jgi:acyl carrier protein
MTKTELTGWLKTWVSSEMKLDPATVDAGKTLVSYGMDSVHAMMLVGDLEELLDRPLQPTLAWDHPTIDRVAAFLGSADAAGAAASDLLAQLDSLSDEEVERMLASESKAVSA